MDCPGFYDIVLRDHQGAEVRREFEVLIDSMCLNCLI
jgi:hypothetical protein